MDIADLRDTVVFKCNSSAEKRALARFLIAAGERVSLSLSLGGMVRPYVRTVRGGGIWCGYTSGVRMKVINVGDFING